MYEPPTGAELGDRHAKAEAAARKRHKRLHTSIKRAGEAAKPAAPDGSGSDAVLDVDSANLLALAEAAVAARCNADGSGGSEPAAGSKRKLVVSERKGAELDATPSLPKGASANRPLDDADAGTPCAVAPACADTPSTADCGHHLRVWSSPHESSSFPVMSAIASAAELAMYREMRVLKAQPLPSPTQEARASTPPRL